MTKTPTTVTTKPVKLKSIIKEKAYPNFYLVDGITENNHYFFACYDPYTGWLRAGTSTDRRSFGKGKTPYNIYEENVGPGRVFYINSLMKTLAGRVELNEAR